MAAPGPGNIAAHLRDRSKTGNTRKVRRWHRPPVLVPHNPQEDEGEQKNEFTGDKGGWRGKRVIRGGGKLGAALGWLAGKIGIGGVVTPAAAGYVGHRAEDLITGDAARDMAQGAKRSLARLARVRAGPQNSQGSQRDSWHMSEEGKSKSVLRSHGIASKGKPKRTAIEGTQNPEDTLMINTSRSTSRHHWPTQIVKIRGVKEHRPVLAPHDEGNYEEAMRKLRRHGEMKTTKWSQRREMAGNSGRFTNFLKQVGLGKPHVHKRSRAIRKN